MRYHAGTLLATFISINKIKSVEQLISSVPKPVLSQWENIGGQLIRSEELEKSLKQIKSGKMKSWEDIHNFYLIQAEKYSDEKLSHALAALKKVSGFSFSKFKASDLKELLQDSINTKQWMVDNIYNSREKDYTNPFRTMVYENEEEMNKVIGSLDDNPFILQEQEGLKSYKRKASKIIRDFNL